VTISTTTPGINTDN